MPSLIRNLSCATLVATACFNTLASDGVIHIKGAVTAPTCAVDLAPDQPVPVRLAQQVPGCEGTGNIAELTLREVGEPREGLALVTVDVY